MDHDEWWAAQMMYPGDERYYRVERDDDGIPIRLTPIDRPVWLERET